MWLTVNGETRQRSTTANMIFDVAALVSYISDFMTLLPGDVVELGIDGLGQARQRIVAYAGT